MASVKLPFGPRELIEYFDRYCIRHNVVGRSTRKKLWWAMFYCAQDGVFWNEPDFED